MASALLSFLILLVVIVIVAGLILWAVDNFLPEVARPARLIVGGVALIFLLVKLAALFGGSLGF